VKNKDAQFGRAPFSTEPLNDPALVARYSTRRFHTPGASGPHPLATSNRDDRAGEAVLGVSLNAQSQAPDIPVVSSRDAFSRYAASLQDQSKVLDLPSLRAFTEEVLVSFNTQAKAPDIQLLVLRAFSEDLSTSFNVQKQAPDDSHAQDRQCASRVFVESPHHCRQVFVRSPTMYDILHLSFQLVSHDSAQELSQLIFSSYPGVSRSEFQFCCL
jgi:hypothetical protein